MGLDNPASRAQRAIWKVVARIPVGHVMTYGKGADQAGLGRAARMVSSALRGAPEEMQLPWHRVINSQGKISFPVESKQYNTQKSLLEAEGIIFLRGRVDLDKYSAADSVDSQLWAVMF